MDGNAFILSDDVQCHWNSHEPSGSFEGYQKNENFSCMSSYGWKNQGESDYFNHFDNFMMQQQEMPFRRQWQHGEQRRRPLTCGPCSRTFYSQQRMDEHLKDHVDCPFPECTLNAHIKVIDQHINNQHMLVNFAALQIDDETWIAERKKRFPTAERAELRRAQQMEKLKRGEKLGISNKPFGHKRDDNKLKRKRYDIQSNGRTDIQNRNEKDDTLVSEKVSNVSSANCKQHKRNEKDERPLGPCKPSLEVDLFESGDEEVYGVQPFRGTKKFYESTGEINYFSGHHDCRNDMDNDLAISDEEEWESEPKKDTGTKKLVLGGALGTLMGLYSDSEEEQDEKQPITVSSTIVKKEELFETASALSAEETRRKEDIPLDGKEEVKFNRRKRYRTHKKSKAGAKQLKKIHSHRKRRSLLERLLQADIIHERNVILQCVRYIVDNNFFDDSVIKQCKETESEISHENLPHV